MDRLHSQKIWDIASALRLTSNGSPADAILAFCEARAAAMLTDFPDCVTPSEMLNLMEATLGTTFEVVRSDDELVSGVFPSPFAPKRRTSNEIRSIPGNAGLPDASGVIQVIPAAAIAFVISSRLVINSVFLSPGSRILWLDSVSQAGCSLQAGSFREMEIPSGNKA